MFFDWFYSRLLHILRLSVGQGCFFFKFSPLLFYKVFWGGVYQDTLLRGFSSIYLWHILTLLKCHVGYSYRVLSDIVVVDHLFLFKAVFSFWRFEVIYLLSSLNFNTRLKLRVGVLDGFSLDSVSGLYAGAFWLEREVWDMFGIFFFTCSSLRRLLTDFGFIGHPLRKDFPLGGFGDLFFCDLFNALFYFNWALVESFRIFNFCSFW